MSKIDMDTTQVDKLYYDMLADIKLYNESISSFFNLIKDVPSISREWIGKTAEEYVSMVCANEVTYNDLGVNLSNFAALIDKSRSDLDMNISKYNIKDRKYD